MGNYQFVYIFRACFNCIESIFLSSNSNYFSITIFALVLILVVKKWIF